METPSINKALPLKERLNVARTAQAAGNDGSKAAAPESYSISLEGWRQNPSLHKEEIWAQRLDALQCDGAALEAALNSTWRQDTESYGMMAGELYRVARGVCAIADSIAPDAASYGRGESQGAGRLNLTGMFIAVELYAHQEMASMLAAAELANRHRFDSEAIRIATVTSLMKVVQEQLMPALITAYNLHVDEAGLPDADVHALMDAFVADCTLRGEWLAGFFDAYPVALYRLARNIRQWLAVTRELLMRLDTDIGRIEAAFGIDTSDIIVGWDGPAGDAHNHGRAVCIINLSSGRRFVYKPRSFGGDQLFRDILRWALDQGFPIDSQPVEILDCGEYGFMEYIVPKPLNAPEDAAVFFRRQGAYLALFYFLGGSDLNYENIIAVADHACFTDLECLFGPRPVLTQGRMMNPSSAAEFFYDSVMRTGLLPAWTVGNADAVGPNMGGLSNVTTVGKGFRAVWRTDASGHLFQKYEEAAIARECINLPRYGGHIYSVADHVDELIEGFSGCYDFLRYAQDDLQRELEAISLHVPAPVRILLRHTNIYARVLRESAHPKYMGDAVWVDQLFDNLWGAFDAAEMPAAVIQSEIDQLWNGDIPLFQTYPDSRNLYDAYGNLVVPQYFAESGLDAIQRRLVRASEHDKQRHIEIIKRSFAIFEHVDSLLPLEQAPVIETSRRTLAGDECIEAAIKIGDRIMSDSLTNDEENEWVWIDLNVGKQGQWEQTIKMPGLYDGTDGLALFFAYLHQASGEQRFRTVAESLARINIRMVKNLEENDPGLQGMISPMLFPLSTLYLCEHLHALWGDEWSGGSFEGALLKRIQRELCNDAHYDILQGACGAITFLSNRVEKRGADGDAVRSLLESCGDYLIDNGTRTENGLAWKGRNFEMLGGFSHGTSGYAWALVRMGHLLGDEKFMEAGLEALRYDRSLFDPVLGAWRDLRYDAPQAFGAWCHGSAGIGLSRLLAFPYIDDSYIDQELRLAADHMLEAGFMRTHSVCHGLMGNCEVLKAIGTFLGDENVLAGAESYVADALMRVRQGENWRCGVTHANIDQYGFFIGLAGIGHSLLRFADWNSVPSILALEGPLGGTAPATGVLH